MLLALPASNMLDDGSVGSGTDGDRLLDQAAEARPSVLRGASIEAKVCGDGHRGLACATPKAMFGVSHAWALSPSPGIGSPRATAASPGSPTGFLRRELAVKFGRRSQALHCSQPMRPTQVKVISHISQEAEFG